MKRLLPILLLVFANEANAAVIWSFPPTEKAFFAIAILYLLNIHWWVITFVLAWLVCAQDNNSADRKSFEHRVFITVLACGVAIVILEHGVLKNQIYVWPLILVCVAMSLAANWARDLIWKKKSPSTSNEKKVTTSQVSSEKQSVVDASLPASTASEAMTIVRKTKTDTRSMGDGTTDTPRTSGSRASKSNPDPLSSVEANKRAFKKIVQEVQREQKSLGSGETSVVDASLSASTASESIPNAGRDIKTLDDSKSHGAVEIGDHLPFGMPIGSKSEKKVTTSGDARDVSFLCPRCSTVVRFPMDHSAFVDCPKCHAKFFANSHRVEVSPEKQSVIDASVSTSTESEYIPKVLRDLKMLLDDGVISEEDFSRKKQELLNRV